MDLFNVFRDSFDGRFANEKLGIVDRLRGIAEILLFGWTIPFRYRKFVPNHEENENT